MVSQVSFDCEVCIGNENLGNKGGDSSVPSHSPDQAGPNVPVKKQTRQWAAWTRQEEESFFAALRQVGKNFEKITCRVQSKNKDQVRHYYYRLVRRMNKLLGPELCLDAKNSKDTNAAMLRWWSLLEKHSCKASKLHLKPRRFKIFIETLENQLLKDRKRNVRKRIPGGENNSSTVHIPASSQVKTSVHDNRAVKLVLVDNQKIGNGKGSLSKRHVNIDINRTSSRVDPTSMKAAKHRRKTAAYKRWETAAIAGVTLVADAAEHLERVSSDKEIDIDQETPGHDGSQQVVEMAHPLPISSQIMFNENNIQNSTKLKLQLFPIDECTRNALEMDHHNPHLELTLSTRKKISSVVEHLNRKWGNSYFMSQELILFPSWAQRENVVGYQKWTKDCSLCAADIYHLIGSPPIFRLRYGWFSKAEIELATAQSLSCANLKEQNLSINIEKEQNISPRGFCYDHHIPTREKIAGTPSSTCAPINRVECCGSSSDVNISRYDPTASSPGRDTGAFAVTMLEANRKHVLSAGDWADSLTNISVGDLLSDSTHNMGINYSDFPVPVNSNCHSQIPFSCESFDAAIAAHICKHKNEVNLQKDLPSHVPSILDAEETCDAFAFQKDGALCDKDYSVVFRNDSPEARAQTSKTSSPPCYKELEELPDVEKLANPFPVCGNLMDDCRPAFTSENTTKDIGGLNELYWPDSLGPLDLEIPRCRYANEELIFSDSLGGLNRLIANSLDAFQSCSFFGFDKKEPESTAEHCQTTSFSELKIGSEV